MVGEMVGSYVIERKLGEGGMGEVYLAAHRRIERRVAIRVLLPEYSRDQNHAVPRGGLDTPAAAPRAQTRL